MNRSRRTIALTVLVGFLVYTGAYIFVYLWRAFRLDQADAVRTGGIFQGDPFARAILVAVLFAIGLIVVVYVALSRQHGARPGHLRLRPDLWAWVEQESAATNEPASRLIERAVASYRTRLEGTGQS